MSGFRTANISYTPLFERQPKSEDLVFTYCGHWLPNVILRNNKVSGFICTEPRVADRYRDLAWLLGF
jgi:aminoglycoside phosphotransferase